MKPLSLTLANVGRFPEAEIQFPEGLTALIGPNGSGKSTVLDSIERALFADGSRDLAPCLSPWGDALGIELRFEHGGEELRVRRQYTAKGRGSASLDLERLLRSSGLPWDDPDSTPVIDLVTFDQPERWESLSKENTAATQAHLENLIGLSRQAFNASSFLGQGNASAFLKATPALKKAVLGEILDARNLWPRLAELAKADVRAAEAGLASASGKVEALLAVAETSGDVITALALAQTNADAADLAALGAEQAFELAQAAVHSNAAAAERAKAAQLAEGRAALERERMRGLLVDAKEAVELLTVGRERAAALAVKVNLVPELERQVAARREELLAADAKKRERVEAETVARRQHERVMELERAQTQADDLLDRANVHLAQLERAEDGHELCRECGQTLGAEARQTAISKAKQEREELTAGLQVRAIEAAEANRVFVELEAAAHAIIVPEITTTGNEEDLLTSARQAAQDLAALEVTIAALEQQAAKVAALMAALAEAELTLTNRAALSAQAQAEMKDDAELRRNADSARAALTQARATLDAANAQVTRLEAELERVKQAQQELAALRQANAKQQQNLDLLKLADRTFGRDGIPTLIAENALGAIEADTNWALEHLPTADGATFRASFITQREQKTVEHLKETLELMISAPDYEQESASLSGGEEGRVALAVRLALAARIGESRLLVADEIPYLDGIGEDSFVDLLKAAVERGMVDTCLVVSHNPNVQDAFDSVIQIVKDDGVSRLVVA